MSLATFSGGLSKIGTKQREWIKHRGVAREFDRKGAVMMLLGVALLLFLFVVWVALPLLPAVLIYRLFPKTLVTAKGPLAGLTINTGGAFAAYLIVFLVTIPMVNTIKAYIGGALRPFWVIHGEVKLVDGGQPVSRQDLANLMELHTRPEVLSHSGEEFYLRIPEEDYGFPKIIFDIPKWGSASIDLNRENYLQSLKRSWSFSKIINIPDVEISKVPPPKSYDSMSGIEPAVSHSP